MKLNPAPVFFISLVGVDDQGFVDEHEHIFDIYTKEYDFLGTSVIAKSAQDLLDFYLSYHKGANRNEINIYELAKFFVQQHSLGHFVIDECPFRTDGKNIQNEKRFYYILTRYKFYFRKPSKYSFQHIVSFFV